MGFVETIKDRICESNKKVSFSQKSSVETKSAEKVINFDSTGQSFSIYKNEVIESALFERVTRDCSGKVIRKTLVRRFRKIGSDEWFSVLASIGNDVWNKDFITSTHEEAIKQGEKNNSEIKEEDESNPTVSTATSFTTVNPFEEEKKRRLAKKKKLVIIYAVIGISSFLAYNYYKNK